MFLKIALSILIAVVSLLTILLDYEWVDKRFAKRKFARKALLVSLVILSLVAVWNAIADERDRARTAEQISGLEKQAQQAEAGNRESVQRLLEEALKETTWNVEIALKNKSGFAYSLATDPPQDDRRFRYELSMMTGTPFMKNVPKIYDLKLLWAYGGKGENAFRSIQNAYSRIEWMEKEEGETIRLIEKEPKDKKELCGSVLRFYDDLRADLQKTEVDIGILRRSLPKS
jgi:hypothetical protein